MIQPPYGKPWLLYGLLGSSLALNMMMVLDRGPAPAAETPPPATEVLQGDAARPEAPTPPPVDEVTQAPVGVLSPEEQAIADAAVVGAPGEWQVVEAKVQHSLARTFQDALNGSEHADALGAVFARLFMWDLDMRKDLQQGDRVRVAWRVGEDGMVEISAATFRSLKYGRTLTAYRWQAPGDAFPSYWQVDGTEVPFRLQDSPIESYDQITSLLKDRPTHKGMDFKTPVGTPVRTPRAGKVTRTNWNWAGNGNCVEIQFDDGLVAKYLHLSELKATAGSRVQAGQVVALSGNTGRSTAPHLHYQLEKGEQVVDPIDYHGTSRRQLPSEVMPTFLQEVERLTALLQGT